MTASSLHRGTWSCYGLGLELVAPSHQLFVRAVRCLPPRAVRADVPVDRSWEISRDGDAFLLRENGEVQTRRPRVVGLLEALRVRAKGEVAEWSPDLVFVHAGVVEVGGRALVIPGFSHSGKSTLTAALVREGAAYLSDEYAVLDEQGLVHAYPQPLGMRDPETRRQEPVEVEAIGGVREPGPLRIGTLLSTKYERRARWAPRELSHGQGVLEMLAHTVPARREPQKVLERLTLALEGARVIQTPRGEAKTAARRLLTSVESPPCG